MTGLDTNYKPLLYLEPYFVDKVTGEPLAAGTIGFYKDQARTELKDIFQITGSPPNYTYTPLPNPLTLSSVGTFVDGSGNNVIPYAYPYDANGNLELYYVEVKNSLGTPQWTRQGVPNEGEVTDNNSLLTNYIPDGQFLTHNFLPNDGLISTEITYIARGGWYFQRSAASTATDYITFPRFGSYVSYPTSNPRYACRSRCTVAGTDAKKYLVKYFYDVNKFASTTQKYTLTFTAQSNSGSSTDLTIKLEKYFGTGGSVTEISDIKTGIVIGTSYQTYNVSFVFGTTEGKTIGSNDDDQIRVIFSFLPTNTYDVSITDISLVQGELELNQFPTETVAQTLFNSMAGFSEIPKYDGSDLYLPIVRTPTGDRPYNGDIGKVFSCAYATPNIGELECNGAVLDVDGHSTDGIPYARLHTKLYNLTYNLPVYGTGASFVWTKLAISGSSDTCILTTNTPLAATQVVDGTIGTGFTFNHITIGSANYDFSTGIDSNGKIYAQNDVGGASNGAPGAGTSGFTVAYIVEGDAAMPNMPSLVGIEVPSIASLAGKYFLISSDSNDYYVWFKVDGSGSDPAPGGSGILTNLLSAYTLDDVRQIIKDVVGGYYICGIQFVAGSSVTAGSWFEFHTGTGDHYYVWYKVDGIGTDPAVSGATGILINISGTDSAADVCFGTLYVINNLTYAIPDYRGLFPRYWNHGATARDPDAATRISWSGSLAGDNVGSAQPDQNKYHNHIYTELVDTVATWALPAGVVHGVKSSFTSSTGGNQSNPINVYHMAVIKY